MITNKEFTDTLKGLGFYRDEDSDLYLTIVTTNQFNGEPQNNSNGRWEGWKNVALGPSAYKSYMKKMDGLVFNGF